MTPSDDPRVVLVVPTFPKASETFVAYPFAELVKRGWDVHVVCSLSGDWSAFPELDRPKLRRRVHLAPPTGSRFRALFALPKILAGLVAQPRLAWKSLRSAPDLREGIRRLYLDSTFLRLRPDLVHFEFGTLAVGREHLGEVLGCRVLVSFRGFDLELSGQSRPDYYREVWRKADAFHFLSRALWKRARERGCPESVEKAFVSPAIDAEFFRPQEAEGPGRDSPARPLEIVSVGRLTWQKGWEYDLLALAELIHRGVEARYTILGDGSFRPAVAFAVHQLGLEEHVELKGHVSHDEVPPLLARSDVFLHLAVSEGFCNAVLEAQAAGLPAVVSDAGGLPESVVDGKTGFVVARRNALEAAERLQVLAEDPESRRSLGARARRRALHSFEISTQIDRFENLYRMLLEGTAHGS